MFAAGVLVGGFIMARTGKKEKRYLAFRLQNALEENSKADVKYILPAEQIDDPGPDFINIH